jgi:glycosyltransferase involved in cell wall biosynthesis
MNLVGVMDEDPFDPLTWSGSSVYFFQALERRGVLRSAISAETSEWVRNLYKLANFQPNLRSWKFKFHLDINLYRQMTKRASQRLEVIPSDEYDFVLQVGAWYDMTKATNKPVFSYHDGSLATLLKSPYGYPPITTRHIERALTYERDLYQRISLIFPMSRWLADSFITDNGASSSRVYPVGAGINLPKIRDTSSKSYESPRVLFVGKDFARKGGKDLLKAFSLVRREIPQAELTIVGPVLSDLPHGVTCTGPLSKLVPEELERLLEEYEQATVFVMPSLYEPFGIAFAEAMAHRLPCIGTAICAIPELISSGETGYLVPPANPSALASSILSLLKDPEACKEFGNAGFDKYVSSFTWDAVTRRICEVIESRYS